MFAITVVLAALIAGSGPAAYAQSGSSGGAADVATLRSWNQTVPPLALTDLQGQARRIEEWRGKVVVVHFWATWCEPCVDELPALMKFRNAMRGQPFEVVTVNLGEGDARIRNFYNKLGLDFVTLLDRDGDAKKQWRVGGVPMSFVLGADGSARYRYFGEIDWGSADILAKFVPLIGEAKRLGNGDSQSATTAAPGPATAPRRAG